MKKYLLWLLIGGLALFLIVTFLYQQFVNSFANLGKKEPIGFFEADFRIVGAITLVLIAAAFGSIINKGR